MPVDEISASLLSEAVTASLADQGRKRCSNCGGSGWIWSGWGRYGECNGDAGEGWKPCGFRCPTCFLGYSLAKDVAEALESIPDAPASSFQTKKPKKRRKYHKTPSPNQLKTSDLPPNDQWQIKVPPTPRLDPMPWDEMNPRIKIGRLCRGRVIHRKESLCIRIVNTLVRKGYQRVGVGAWMHPDGKHKPIQFLRYPNDDTMSLCVIW